MVVHMDHELVFLDLAEFLKKQHWSMKGTSYFHAWVP